MTQKTKILLIEDEEKIRKFTSLSLKSLGYKVEEAVDAGQGLRLSGTIKPDLIVCDLGLPDRDGMDLLKDLKSLFSIPIVILSARSEDEEIIKALDLGADDYVVKPFNVEVLAARIRTVLRKNVREQADSEDSLECGIIKMNLLTHEVFKDGEKVNLTPKEFKLLRYFIKNLNKMMTHEQIMRDVWGEAHLNDGHYLRIYVGQLRKKLEDDPEDPCYILNVPGIGYRMEAPKIKISA